MLTKKQKLKEIKLIVLKVIVKRWLQYSRKITYSSTFYLIRKN